MSEYADRDPQALGKHYTRHVEAMTAEGLHSKADIAAELAWRDARIEALFALLEFALDKAEGLARRQGPGRPGQLLGGHDGEL